MERGEELFCDRSLPIDYALGGTRLLSGTCAKLAEADMRRKLKSQARSMGLNVVGGKPQLLFNP